MKRAVFAIVLSISGVTYSQVHIRENVAISPGKFENVQSIVDHSLRFVFAWDKGEAAAVSTSRYHRAAKSRRRVYTTTRTAWSSISDRVGRVITRSIPNIVSRRSIPGRRQIWFFPSTLMMFLSAGSLPPLTDRLKMSERSGRTGG